jgi:aspartyl-tRNA(Asn)/glutamyl-tRNA(Gln) amidotransferase subunit A
MEREKKMKLIISVNVHPEIIEKFKETLEIVKKQGVSLTEDFPDLGNLQIEKIFNTIWMSGCARNYLVNNLSMEDLDEGLQRYVKKGMDYSAVEYIKAENERYELGVIMNKFHEKYDLLLTPTVCNFISHFSSLCLHLKVVRIIQKIILMV